MTQGREESTVQARQKGLLKRAVDDEVLVYDLERHKAHCLNKTAALVWEECDGNKTVAEVALAVEQRLKAPFHQDMVWVALDQLDRANLLASKVDRPDQTNGLTRRQMIKRAGLAAAIALPLITSVMSPTPAQASTCTKKGGGCTSSLTCCSQVCVASKCL
jgi:hypothetical protein